MRHLFKSFAKSEHGNFAMITAITMSALIGAVGLGVNLAQMYHTKSNLRNALDAAVTSTARDLTTGRIAEKDARKSVETLLQANSTGGFAANGAYNLGLLTINRVDKTVAAVASADVDVAFPLFGMAKRNKVVSQSAAIYSDKTIEVAMMLDVTGSMGYDAYGNNDPKLTKINGLKDASKAAVETFLNMNRNAVTPRVRVALVPYSQAVNVGGLRDVIFNEDPKIGEKPLSLLKWLAALLTGQATRALDDCSTERKRGNGSSLVLDTSDEDPASTMVNRDMDLKPYTDSKNRRMSCPKAAVQPLSANAEALKSTIDNFVPGGNTAGHIGIQWTRYVLSPKWKTALGAANSGSEPGEYKSKRIGKVAILMTDGEFNTAYVEPNKGEQATRSKDYAKTLCKQMKADGIEVFTIGFMLKASEMDTLQDCATPDKGALKHFYAADNPAELKAAFLNIAQNVERVRLTN